MYVSIIYPFVFKKNQDFLHHNLKNPTPQKQALPSKEDILFQRSYSLLKCRINGNDSVNPADAKNFHYSFTEAANCQQIVIFLHLFGKKN